MLVLVSAPASNSSDPATASLKTGRRSNSGSIAGAKDGEPLWARTIWLDFEDGGLVGWTVREGDQAHLRFSIADERPISGRMSLRIDASGWDTLRPSNECAVLRYRPLYPVVLQPDYVVSWLWWILDRDRNDGINLSLYLRDPISGQTWTAEWMSHSLRARGPWPFDDPEGRIVQHQECLGKRFENNRDAIPLAEFCRLEAIEILLVSPVDQIALLDNIWIGPADQAPPRQGEVAESAERLQPRSTCIQIGDLDGSGDLIELVGQGDASPVLRIMETGRGPKARLGADLGLGDLLSPRSPVFADLDQDGQLDLAVLIGGQIRLYQGVGEKRFAPRPAPVLSTLDYRGPIGLLAADLLPPDGPELLVHRSASILDDTLFTVTRGWSMTPMRFPAPGDTGRRGNYRACLAVADVDNDGDLDLFAGNSDLYLQDRTRGILERATEQWLPLIGQYQTGACFGDIDGDGDMDLFIAVDIRNQVNEPAVRKQTCLLLRNDGNRFTDVTPGQLPATLRHVHCPILEDFDLDGDLDLFCTRDNRWDPPGSSDLAGNIYLENAGNGYFRLPDRESWITQSPPAIEAIPVDADFEGGVDLLLRTQEFGDAVLCLNRSNSGREPIRVRVLDRRGIPHAGAARVELFDRLGSLAAYRQTGVGSMLPGVGATVLACPDAVPATLRVTFPSAPEHPVVRRNIRSGQVLVVVEPAASGRLAASASGLLVRARQIAVRPSGWPMSRLVPIVLLFGVLLGAASYGARGLMILSLGWCGFRPRPARRHAVGPGSMPGPWLRAGSLLVCLAVLAATGLVVSIWPSHPMVTGRLAVLGGALLLGALTGAAISAMVSRWRRRLSTSDRLPDARFALLEAVDGFSHAQWIKHLGGIAMLARGLAEGSDPVLTIPRLESRLRSYREIIQPQMLHIERILPQAGLDEGLRILYEQDFRSIEHAMTGLSRGLQCEGSEGLLEELARAAGRMHGTIDKMFHSLGKVLRTDVRAALEHSVERVRPDHPGVEFRLLCPAKPPEVFGEPGELANIFENLVVNGARAAEAARPARIPKVEIEVVLEGSLLLVLVRDTGPGLSREKLEELVGTRTLDPSRHGRGLAYATRRLRQLDGNLQVLPSSDKEGTSVAVTLRTLSVNLEQVESGYTTRTSNTP